MPEEALRESPQPAGGGAPPAQRGAAAAGPVAWQPPLGAAPLRSPAAPRPPPQPPFHRGLALPATPRCPSSLAVATGGAEAQGGGSAAAPAAPAGGAGWAVAPGGLRPASPALLPVFFFGPSPLAAAPAVSACWRCQVTRSGWTCFVWKWKLFAAVRGGGGLGPWPFVSGSRGTSLSASLSEPDLGLRKR